MGEELPLHFRQRRMSAMHDAWAKSVGVMPWETVSGRK